MRSRRSARPVQDKGSALMLCIVFVLLGSLLIVPLLRYTATVIRANGQQRTKINAAEVARGALRTAMANPEALYDVCSDAGLHTAVELAAPDLGLPVHMECTTVKSATELDDTELRLALATTIAGSVLPQGLVGTPYADSGSLDTSAWIAQTTSESQGGMIFLPELPSHALNHPATGGYMMPAWAGTCRVFFPGTYSEPVLVNDATPTYFASGVYYFEDSVTFSGSANVVVGQGAIPGCAEDQDAAFNAINAPFTPNVSGLGATFIFGDAGRLVVTDGGGSVGPSVQFNSRLVDPTDVGSQVSAGVSIVSVNGVTAGSTSSSALEIPGVISVPKSYAEFHPGDGTPPADAASASYHPSTLIPTVSPDPPNPAIIDIQFTGTGSALLFVPGYTAVPQGTISVYIGPGMGSGKSVQIVGGILAAQVVQSTDLPEVNQIGHLNRVVQKTFKIVAETLGQEPNIVSVALVQVNDYGEYAINSWVTTTQ